MSTLTRALADRAKGVLADFAQNAKNAADADRPATSARRGSPAGKADVALTGLAGFAETAAAAAKLAHARIDIAAGGGAAERSADDPLAGETDARSQRVRQRVQTATLELTLKRQALIDSRATAAAQAEEIDSALSAVRVSLREIEGQRKSHLSSLESMSAEQNAAVTTGHGGTDAALRAELAALTAQFEAESAAHEAAQALQRKRRDAARADVAGFVADYDRDMAALTTQIELARKDFATDVKQVDILARYFAVVDLSAKMAEEEEAEAAHKAQKLRERAMARQLPAVRKMQAWIRGLWAARAEAKAAAKKAAKKAKGGKKKK